MKLLIVAGDEALAIRLAELLRSKSLGAKVMLDPERVTTLSERYPNLGFAAGALDNPEQLMSLCKQCDAVFHLAIPALPPAAADDRLYQNQVKHTQNLINACARQKVKRLVMLSSAQLLLKGARDRHPHLKSLALAEQRVLAADGMESLSTTVVRRGFAWGASTETELMDLLRCLVLKKHPCVGDGRAKVSVASVANTAQALFRVATVNEVGAKVFLVSDGPAMAFGDWLDMLASGAGLSVCAKRLDPNKAARLLRRQQALQRWLPWHPQPLLQQRVIDYMSLTNDHAASTLSAVPGYRALQSPKEALAETVQFLQQQFPAA